MVANTFDPPCPRSNIKLLTFLAHTAALKGTIRITEA
jgi:hypothetical protein